MGIETAKKYAHLQELGTYERVAIEGKDTKIAAFYQCFRSKMDCNELYKEFIDISERVMELGLE